MRIAIILILVSAVQCQRKNVCNNFFDYNLKDISPNCRFNPDAKSRTDDTIIRHGYPMEKYTTETADHFILTVFRIPPRNQNVKGIVFLQHPALSSSSVWLVSGNESFAFLLSDAGYDVWLGNFRTTSYSEKNKFLSKEENPEQYWNYTFHEYGIYDVPAQIELVRQKTGNGQKIIYIGHSVATSAGLVYSSLKSVEAEEHVKLFIFWSPIAFLGNVRTPLRVFAPFTNLIGNILTKILQIRGITFHGPIHKTVENICLSIPSLLQECSTSIDIIAGPQNQHGNPPELPVLIYQSFEGFSVKTLAHFGQLVSARDRFQWFDYGESLNKAYYNSKYPPVYPLNEIKVPVHLVFGGNDYFATEKDTYVLYSKLQENVKMGVGKIDQFSHFDFHYGKQVKELLHIPTIQYLETYLTK